MKRCYVEGTIWCKSEPAPIPHQDVYLCSEVDALLAEKDFIMSQFAKMKAEQIAALVPRLDGTAQDSVQPESK